MSSSRRFAINIEGDVEGQCVSIEARQGVSTGISVADRICTIGILSERIPDRTQIVSPGHIVPYVARDGGVLIKHSIKEAALDLVKAGGFTEAAVVIDCLNHKGELLTEVEVEKLAAFLDLPVTSVEEVVRSRLLSERLINKEAETIIPTEFGNFRGIIYSTPLQGREPLALIKGDINSELPVLTRVHVENSFEDIFGSGMQGNRRQLLHESMRRIDREGSGVILYLRKGSDHQKSSQIITPSHGERIKEYGLGAQVLLDLGVKQIRLLTNSDKNLVGLDSFGIKIVQTETLNLSPEGRVL
jgi:3,4-dihydroxy 2-butanone 4-phosphate synthase/GTP cyclohydrolase II